MWAVFRKTEAKDLLGFYDGQDDQGLVAVGFSCALGQPVLALSRVQSTL